MVKNSDRYEIPSLTGLRIFGAVWVSLMHMQDLIYTAFPAAKILQPFISQGHFGVALFFVLSGYIICHSYSMQSVSSFFGFGRFMWRRYARLLPVNIVTQILVIPLCYYTIVLKGNWGLPVPSWYSLSGWLESALMIQEINYPKMEYPWNQPTWSLTGEILCYLLYPAILFLLLKLRLKRLSWFTLAVLFAYSAQGNFGFLPYSWFLYLLLLFISGVCLRLSGRPSESAKKLLSILQIVLPFAVMYACTSGYRYVSMLLLLTVYSVIEAGYVNKFLSTQLMQYLGGISYSLYMIHWIVNGYVFMIFLSYPYLKDNHFSSLASVALLSVPIFSAILYKYIEGPARKYMNSIFDRRFLGV